MKFEEYAKEKFDEIKSGIKSINGKLDSLTILQPEINERVGANRTSLNRLWTIVIMLIVSGTIIKLIGG